MKPKGKNPWMTHLGKVRKLKENKGKPLSEMMKIARKTYTPLKDGSGKGVGNKGRKGCVKPKFTRKGRK